MLIENGDDVEAAIIRGELLCCCPGAEIIQPKLCSWESSSDGIRVVLQNGSRRVRYFVDHVTKRLIPEMTADAF